MAMPTWMKKWKEWQDAMPEPYSITTDLGGTGFKDTVACVCGDKIFFHAKTMTDVQALGLADWIYATLERKHKP